MSDESGGEDESGWRGDMIAYALEDGHEILVSPSFAQPDVASCSVMISREKPGPVPKEWKKDIVASALLGALAAANGEAHKIFTIRKYSKNQSVICVRFGSASSAATLIASRTVKIADELCTVSQYGEVPVRIQLSRVPLLATAEEVVNCVKHLGTIKQITRPLIQGYEDHIVSVILTPSPEVDFVEEQNKVLRQANFGGKSHIIQYRCLDEIVVCAACKEKGHFNGPKCPMVNKCLLCSEEGHQRRNCPRRRAFPDREERDPQARPPATEQTKPPAPTIAGKPPAPPPPPADASALQSTGLPSLGGSTWGSFDPGVSEIEMRPSKSPLERDYRSSTRSIVSDGRQARLEKAIRGGKLHAEALREQMKEKKRRDKEAKTKYGSAPGLMMQCVSQSSQDEIPQTDGPTDSPAATSHMSEPSEIEEAADDSSTDDTGTDDGETFNKTWVFKDYGEWKIQEIIDNQHNYFCSECGEEGCPNLCITCPIFPTTWCSKEHKCVTAQSQLAALSMDVTDIPPCSYCGLIGMHTCDNDNCKRIPNLESC